MKNLKVNVQDVNARPPQPTLARKMLNDSVASGTCDRTSTIHLGIRFYCNISSVTFEFSNRKYNNITTHNKRTSFLRRKYLTIFCFHDILLFCFLILSYSMQNQI